MTPGSVPSPWFTPAHEQLRAELRGFLAREVLPFADAWERDRKVPRDLFAKMGQAGYLGLHQPEAWGGGGKDLFFAVVLLEELGRTGYSGVRVAIAVHALMASAYLAHAGSAELRARYLRPAIAGQRVGALALTEPGVGTDLARLAMTATADGDDYVLDGTKRFVANGTLADFVVVAARTDPGPAPGRRGGGGVTLFVVDAPTPGLRASPLDALGWHACDLAELRFEGVRVPAAQRIGQRGQGFVYLMRCLQLERLAAGVLAIGGADACLDHAWRYLKGREVFGQTLSRFPAVRQGLAELVVELEAARHLAWYAAWRLQVGDLAVAECSMAKLKGTEIACRIALECLQLQGAQGYLADSPAARMARDAQAATLAGGASAMMRDIVAETTLDDPTWRAARRGG